MPTYDYRCRDCGHAFEVQQSFSDDPLTTCPECGGDLRKVFSPVGISFKGSGFYKTDSRGGSGSSSSTASTSDTTGTTSSSGDSTPSAPTTGGSDGSSAPSGDGGSGSSGGSESSGGSGAGTTTSSSTPAA